MFLLKEKSVGAPQTGQTPSIGSLFVANVHVGYSEQLINRLFFFEVFSTSFPGQPSMGH